MLNKRVFLGAMGAAALAPWGVLHAGPGVTDGEIVLGQSLDLSGPLAEMAPDMVNATKVCFDAVNAQGGVHGRRIRVVTLDDGYKPDNTVKNVGKMIAEDGVFALCNLTGTANVAAILPMLAKENPPVPLISPLRVPSWCARQVWTMCSTSAPAMATRPRSWCSTSRRWACRASRSCG